MIPLPREFEGAESPQEVLGFSRSIHSIALENPPFFLAREEEFS
jgi:hypothetical protein